MRDLGLNIKRKDLFLWSIGMSCFSSLSLLKILFAYLQSTKLAPRERHYLPISDCHKESCFNDMCIPSTLCILNAAYIHKCFSTAISSFARNWVCWNVRQLHKSFHFTSNTPEIQKWYNTKYQNTLNKGRSGTWGPW